METFLDSGEAVQTEFFEYLLFLIIQSKVFTQDIEEAIKNSNLKPTFTPCVLLKKGVEFNNLKKISNLEKKEKLKSFRLLLELFKITYKRRFEVERDDANKWWYWDLSDPRTEYLIYQKYSK